MILTYEELCTFDILYNAYIEARRCKRSKQSTAYYETNILLRTNRLQYLLGKGIYYPGKLEVFFVYEPKKRLVHAPAFTDKVILHAVADNFLYDIITKTFIRDNYASQKGKGTDDGVMRIKQYMTEYYRKYKTADGWVLKGDVRHFFASINHEKLKEKLKALFIRYNIDMRIFNLLCMYIDGTDGLPLGYQTSQLFALLFLDEFDHLIKEGLQIRFYGRYMDDFYIICHDKNQLREILRTLKLWIADNDLELNEKTAIFPLRNGIDFLGFHTYLTDTGKVVQKLRNSSIDRINRRLKYWREAYPAGEVAKETIIDSWQSWDSHAAHGDTYKLREKYAKLVGEIVGENLKPRRKISAPTVVRQKRRIKEYQRTHPSPEISKSWCSEPRDDDLPPWE